MASVLAQKLKGIPGRIGDALFGIQPMSVVQGSQYPQELQDYLDNDFENQQYVKDLLNKPVQERMSLDQLKEGFTQGLNFGSQDMANEQKRLNINTPNTGEEIDLAKTGQFNTYPFQSGLVAGPRQGGFFNDFSKGYNDNYYNSFDPSNLAPKQNKGFAVRLGEGLGTLGRFIDSPLGRGLLAAGLNSALGYDNSLQEGLTAYVGRQNNQATDRLYRNQLKQMGYTDEDLAQIKGNLTSDVYKSLISNMYKFKNLDQNTYMKMKTAYDRQLQQGIMTPDEYKASVEALNNQYVNSQIQTMQAGNVQKSNQTRNTDMNEQLLPYKQYALQMSPQIAMGNLGVAQGNLALRQQELPYNIAYKQMQIQNLLNKNQGDKKVQENVNSLNTIKNQLDRFSASFDDVDNPYRYRIAGGISKKLNTLTPQESNFNSQASLLLNKIARDLGGEKGVLSDQDIARIKESMPRLEDTKAQKQGKMNAIYDLLQDRMLQYGNSLNMQTPQQINSDPLGLF